MKLITVEAEFAASDFDTAMRLITEQAEAVLAMPGCTHYCVYRKPTDDGFAIIQHWNGMEAIDAYRASDVFANLNAGLRPLMAKPPVTIIAEVDTV
ncbi:MAG: antibiotic biosynthesis monooxygenase [Pseudomonadota bacterium]